MPDLIHEYLSAVIMTCSMLQGRGKVKNEPVASPDKKKSKRELAREQETKEVWKWWEEEKKEDGKKWKTLQHMGPVFAPPYVPLPNEIKLSYDGMFRLLSIGYSSLKT